MIQNIRDLERAFRAMDRAAEAEQTSVSAESLAVELFAAELAIETPYTREQIKAAVRDVWFQYDARRVPRGDWQEIVREAAAAAHTLQMPLGTVASQIAAALIDEVRRREAGS